MLNFREFLYSIFQSRLDSRARMLAGLIAPALRAGDRVIDVGCGDLKVGTEVKKMLDVNWVGVDTIDYNKSTLPVHLYDGSRLPFPDGHFQAGLLSFVLHHCEEPVHLLREVRRVSRERILIFEDVPRGRWEVPLLRWHDYLANKLLEPEVRLPYTFRSFKEWDKVFRELRLKPIKTASLRTHSLALINQMLFVLEIE